MNIATKKLKTLAKVYNGATPKSDNADFWDGNIPWVTPVDLGDAKYLDSTKRNITETGYRSCNTTLIEANNIIISNRAPIGLVAVNRMPVCTNQGCKALELDKTKIDESYLYYALKASEGKLNSLGTGTTFMEISSDALKNFQIPYVDPEQQKKLSDHLDAKTQTLDKILTTKNHTHTHLSELRQAIIDTAVLGSSMSDLLALKRVAVMINRGASPDYIEGGESKFINQACIYREGIKFSATKSANKLNHPAGSRGYLRKGDVLVNSTGTGTLGRVAVFDQENDGAYFADSHVTIVRPSFKKIDPQYLRYVMLSTKFQDEVYTMCVSGSTNQIELSRERFRELQIPVPSLQEQRKIVRELEEKINKVDEADIILQKSISQLEEYRSSLISSVVGGKVEV